MASSCCRARALPTGCARPFDWQPGRGGVLARLWTESRVQRLHTAPAAVLIAVGNPGQWSPHSQAAAGLKFEVRGLSMRPLRANETRLSTEKKEKKRLAFIFLPGFYFYFSGILNVVYWFKPKYPTVKEKYIIVLS